MHRPARRRFVTEDFKGALGAFTPCFIDVVVLGAPMCWCPRDVR